MIKLTALIIVCFLFSAEANATNLRGYVEKCKDKECESSPNVLVEIYSVNEEELYLSEADTTNQDGYFFFYNIEPGDYKICINGTYWYKVSVKNSKWQDLPVLRFEEIRKKEKK